ncbi:MAG: T9SS type A sorting domain-containing protein [Candidatus Eisenbacteria bacterium]|nr:T9SS type A sorting domain-containing protein [Candidatus Eisenbacteria bacterium]
MGYDWVDSFGPARRSYYGIQAMPTICGDGLTDIWPTSLLESTYNSLSAVPSPLIMDVVENGPGDFTATIIATDDVLDARFVMVAVLDEYVPGASGTQTHLPYHAKEFLTAVTGDAFSISKNETLSIRRTFTVDPSWNYEDMGVAAWVQKPGGTNPSTAWDIPVMNEVFQAAFAPAQATGVDEIAETKIALAPPSPNPFVSSSQLAFALPSAQSVRLDLYDVTGRHVRTLVDERLPAGEHAASWDGRADDGRPCSAGVYFARLSAGEESVSGKLVKLR